MKARLYTDGGARGNPGPAAFGYVLEAEDGTVLAAHGERIPRRAGLLVVSKGLVPPLGTLPSAFASERCRARAVAALGGPAHAAEALEHGASVVVASVDRAVVVRKQELREPEDE